MCSTLRVFCTRPNSPNTHVSGSIPKDLRTSFGFAPTFGTLEPTGRCLTTFVGNHFVSRRTQGSVAVKITSAALHMDHNCALSSIDKAIVFQLLATMNDS